MSYIETETSYIGRTIGIKFHHNHVNKIKITRKQMYENMTVIARLNNTTDLATLETLVIKQHNPVIDKQVKDLSRKLRIF